MVIGYKMNEEFSFYSGKSIFFLTVASRAYMEPSQPSIQWVIWSGCKGQSVWCVQLFIRLDLVLNLGIMRLQLHSFMDFLAWCLIKHGEKVCLFDTYIRSWSHDIHIQLVT
jgi:hypothetical protein